MSLILEALRKSEAERRRGQAPGLYAELPPLVRAPPPAPARRLWWLLGVAAVLAATAWLMRDRWNARPAAQVATGHVATATATAPQRTRAIAATATAAPAPVAIAAPAPAAQPPATDIADATTAAPAQPRAPAPAPAAESAPARPTLADAIDKEGAAAASTRPTEPLPAPSPEPPPAAPEPRATEGPLRLADLSASQREQLPPLKVSMHMWGQAAAQRFAIIDGTRVGEGDRIGEAVVDEITADGVVLSWHGQRVALPIR